MPVLLWWMLLVLGSAWLRYVTPWGVLYPGQWLLLPLLTWALWQGPLARPDGRFEFPPLTPLLAFAGFALLLALLRGQWGIALTLLLGAAAMTPWAWAAYRLGLGGAPMGTFQIACVLYLGTMLAVGLAAWWAQADWPAACILFNCDPSAPIPFPFRGGWSTSGQYLAALIFLLPAVGAAFWESWRRGAGGLAHWLLTLFVAAAGLGLLAGMRWWVFGLLGLGIFLVAQALAPERHPADRLLLRGTVFFAIFSPIAFYGMLPGYGTALLFQPGSARALGIRHTLPSPVVLSSEHDVPETVQVVNAGSVELQAAPNRPLRLRATVLFTPRTGGESRMAAAGDAPIVRDLAPGEATEVTVPIRIPPWVSQGYLSWAAEDETGRPIQVAQELHQGFRFVNGDFSSLTEGGDNTLSALAARARDSAAPLLDLPGMGARRALIEPVLGDAFDTLFFSPLWGQAGADRGFGDVFDPAKPFLLAVLHQYGLIGLGLMVWFFVDALRRSIHLGFRRSSGSGLAPRLVPVSVLLLAALSLPSGELGRFHSWWGCVLLGGFVQGAHERIFPARIGVVWRRMPAWLVPPVKVASGLVPIAVGCLRFAGAVIRGLARGAVEGLQGVTRALTWVGTVPFRMLGGKQHPIRTRGWHSAAWNRSTAWGNRRSWRPKLVWGGGTAARTPWSSTARHARGSPYGGGR